MNEAEEDDSRLTCKHCGAPWSDEMMQTLEMAMFGACAICNPSGVNDRPGDIRCHACHRLLLWAPGHGPETRGDDKPAAVGSAASKS